MAAQPPGACQQAASWKPRSGSCARLSGTDAGSGASEAAAEVPSPAGACRRGAVSCPGCGARSAGEGSQPPSDPQVGLTASELLPCVCSAERGNGKAKQSACLFERVIKIVIIKIWLLGTSLF